MDFYTVLDEKWQFIRHCDTFLVHKRQDYRIVTGSRQFPLDFSPLDIPRKIPPPFLHGVGHSPTFHHHHAPIYKIK